MRDVGLYLTIDVESDYGRSESYEILNRSAPFVAWIREERIPVTAFVVGRLLQQGHPIIESLLNAGASLGVHGFRHSLETFGTMHTSHADEIEKGREAFERRIGRKPAGYRAPAGVVSREDILLIDKLGFRYDASIFPMSRPHRYDFSMLPRTPFRWDGTKLIEMPFGLLTSSLPAGMTYINLFGAGLSAYFVRKQADKLRVSAQACHVTDIHFHNLFSYYPATGCLPFAGRLINLAGSIKGGLRTLKRFVSTLRRAGFVFGDLEHTALKLDAGQLPVVGMACFDGSR